MWYGAVWYGAVDVVWYNMVWSGTVKSFCRQGGGSLSSSVAVVVPSLSTATSFAPPVKLDPRVGGGGGDRAWQGVGVVRGCSSPRERVELMPSSKLVFFRQVGRCFSLPGIDLIFPFGCDVSPVSLSVV